MFGVEIVRKLTKNSRNKALVLDEKLNKIWLKYAIFWTEIHFVHISINFVAYSYENDNIAIITQHKNFLWLCYPLKFFTTPTHLLSLNSKSGGWNYIGGFLLALAAYELKASKLLPAFLFMRCALT